MKLELKEKMLGYLIMLLLVIGMALPMVSLAGQAPVTITTPQITTDVVARTATLTWTAPTLYTDGTPITETVSYNVYEGLCSLSELPKVLGPITALTAVRTNQSVGEVCYQLTAQTPNGGESDRTARGAKTFPVSNPRPNTAPTFTIQ